MEIRNFTDFSKNEIISSGISTKAISAINEAETRFTARIYSSLCNEDLGFTPDEKDAIIGFMNSYYNNNISFTRLYANALNVCCIMRSRKSMAIRMAVVDYTENVNIALKI